MPSPLIQLEANLINLGQSRSLAMYFPGDIDMQLMAFVAAQLEESRIALSKATPRTDEALPNNQLRDYAERPHMADMYHVQMTSARSGYIENESEHALFVAVTGARPHTISPSSSPWLHFFLGEFPHAKPPNIPFDEVLTTHSVDHPGMKRSPELYAATIAEAATIRKTWDMWGARMGVSIEKARNKLGQFT